MALAIGWGIVIYGMVILVRQHRKIPPASAVLSAMLMGIAIAVMIVASIGVTT